MRAVKSPREIALIREATRITGLGIMEVMRDARPGMHEYELQAVSEFVFKKHGAYGPSYFALVATGRNTFYTHYHRNTAVLQDGDLVQFDYAPDYKYYQSDVTRVFPANGRFTPRQREFYTIYLRLYQALLTSITVHVTPGEVVSRALCEDGRDHGRVSRSPIRRSRPPRERFVEGYRGRTNARSLGHMVGLEVHDVGGSAGRHARARPHLHHRAGDADRRRAAGHPAGRHDPDHRDGLREPVGVRPGRDRRHREVDGPAGIERGGLEAAMND